MEFVKLLKLFPRLLSTSNTPTNNYVQPRHANVFLMKCYSYINSDLTKEEKESIKKVWSQIMKDPQGSGELIFKTFLTKHKDYVQKFEKFKGIPSHLLYETPVFKHHSLKIVETLDSVIKNMDKPQDMSKNLESLGKIHANKKLQQQHFYDLKKVILDILRDQLKVDSAGLRAWDKVLDDSLQGIFIGINEQEQRSK